MMDEPTIPTHSAYYTISRSPIPFALWLADSPSTVDMQKGLWECEIVYWMLRFLYAPSVSPAPPGAPFRRLQFFDIGAGSGYFSVIAHALGAATTAVEPDERHLEALRMNGDDGQIDDVKAGVVWPTPSDVFSVEPDASHGYMRPPPHNAQVEAVPLSPTRAVPILSLPALLGQDTNCFVKFDIEGAELRVVSEWGRALYAAAPVVVFEANEECLRNVSGGTLQDLIGALTAVGYDVCIPAMRINGMWNGIAVHPGMLGELEDERACLWAWFDFVLTHFGTSYAAIIRDSPYAAITSGILQRHIAPTD